MKKMFVPLHLTALSIAGFALAPDNERMVEVPDDKLDECLGHGLIPAENEEAINAYLDSQEADEVESEDEDEDPPPAKKTAAKKTAAKKAKPTVRKRA